MQKNISEVIIRQYHIIFLIIICATVKVSGQDFYSFDSVHVKQYDGSDYRSSSYNYKGVEDEDGILYFGNENGLLEFDGSHWKLHQINNFLPVVNLKYVNGRIYISSYDEIGYFSRDSVGHLKYVSIRDQLPTSEELSTIWFICEKDGVIYYNNYDGILKYDGETVTKLPIKNAHLFEVDNQLIASVYGEGVGVLKDDSLTYVNKELKFENDAAFQILPNPENNEELYYFTSESGLYALDRKSFQHRKVDNEISRHFDGKKAYLYNAFSFKDSLAIVSSWEKGFFVADKKGRLVDTINTQAGLKTNLYNSILVDRRENIWLSNAYGITSIQNIADVEDLAFKPAVQIRYIEVNDSLLFAPMCADTLKVEKSESSLDFQFSVPSFFKENLEYRYLLEGYDKNWSDWGINPSKEYTNLPGGTFAFQVEARHVNNKQLKIASAEKMIVVPTLWYKSVWFYVILVLVLTTFILLLIKFRTARLRAINKTLEKAVKTSTRDVLREQKKLKEAYDELKSINHELDNFVYRSSHDLVAPLKSLRGLIEISKMSKDDEEREHYYSLMNVSLNKLEEFIKNIMEFSTNTKKPLQYEEMLFDEVVDGIVEDLKFYKNADRVELKRNYDPEFKLIADRKRLNIILSNLITNAVKYHNYAKDHMPYIMLSVSHVDDGYVISVEDNGKGIPDEFKDKIFDMFFRANQSTEGSGLGLYIVADTLKVLGGKIDVKTKMRQGSTFTITIPLESRNKGKKPIMQEQSLVD